MPRPQVVVTTATAPARRGVETATGNAFMVYPAAAGNAAAQRFTSPATASSADLPAPYAQYVADLFSWGAPTVTVVRAEVAPNDAAAASQSIWNTALGKLTSSFGIGQVLIPGVAAPNAHAALVAHAAATGRTALLDGDVDATVSELSAFRTAISATEGAKRGGLYAGWVVMAGDGGTTRNVPGSVAAAALAARMDGRAGHAGRMPAGTQEFGDAGRVNGAIGVSVSYSDAELDSLADAGVSPFVLRDGAVTLSDWLCVSSDTRWQQLNYGRLAMQITAGAADLLGQFLFRPIDGRGQLFAEVEAAIDGYMLGLYNANAIYGATSDEAFAVDVKGVTSEQDIAAGVIRANLSVAFTPGARRVEFVITVNKPGGLA